MDALAIALSAWIAAKAGWVAPDPPRIVLLPQQNLVEKYQRAGAANSDFRLQAFYLHFPEPAIYLPDTWHPHDLRGRGVLVHELVHHAQRFNEVRVPCPAALERQAFEMQAGWLREHGVTKPYELIGTDEFTVHILYACQTEDYLDHPVFIERPSQEKPGA